MRIGLTFNGTRRVALAAKALELLPPLDQQNSVCADQVVERQRVQLALGIDAIKVDVIERNFRAAIFVDESEGRTSDAISFCRLEALSNAFDQSGLPSSQIAAK